LYAYVKIGVQQRVASPAQVKWNKRDRHLLSTCHGEEVVIWDVRRDNKPLATFKAHNARIYGLDWSYSDKQEFITCGQDKSVKVRYNQYVQ
jgi:WD40 repeat protein